MNEPMMSIAVSTYALSFLQLMNLSELLKVAHASVFWLNDNGNVLFDTSSPL
jgi:hypothetical protein